MLLQQLSWQVPCYMGHPLCVQFQWCTVSYVGHSIFLDSCILRTCVEVWFLESRESSKILIPHLSQVIYLNDVWKCVYICHLLLSFVFLISLTSSVSDKQIHGANDETSWRKGLCCSDKTIFCVSWDSVSAVDLALIRAQCQVFFSCDCMDLIKLAENSSSDKLWS